MPRLDTPDGEFMRNYMHSIICPYCLKKGIRIVMYVSRLGSNWVCKKCNSQIEQKDVDAKIVPPEAIDEFIEEETLEPEDVIIEEETEEEIIEPEDDGEQRL